MCLCRSAEGVSVVSQSEVLVMFVTVDGELLEGIFRIGIKHYTMRGYKKKIK